jgi:hypothetical protein
VQRILNEQFGVDGVKDVNAEDVEQNSEQDRNLTTYLAVCPTYIVQVREL